MYHIAVNGVFLEISGFFSSNRTYYLCYCLIIKFSSDHNSMCHVD